jgi:hypothetical protein
MVINVTPEEQAKFKELNKIRMKLYRDKNRKNKFAPRPKKNHPGKDENLSVANP